jgi:hypothetical protein
MVERGGVQYTQFTQLKMPAAQSKLLYRQERYLNIVDDMAEDVAGKLSYWFIR